MMDFLHNADIGMLMAFNGHHTAWLDSAMMFVSDRHVWIPFYVILAALIFHRFGWKKALVYIAAIGLAITFTDQICASVIRPAVARLRPSNLDNPLSDMITVVNGYRSGSYSFPSCHAANTFALATFISLLFRRRTATAAILTWAAVVSCSRLYLEVHYPSDLIAGAVIGSAIAAALYMLAHISCRRFFAAAMLLFAANGATAQTEFKWNIELNSVFDNRECDARYTPTKTYFFTQLAPEIGVSFDSGRHAVMGGAVWNQPIGCEWDGHRISPTLYYLYSGTRWQFAMGMVPYRHLIRPLPNYIQSDSTRYFQHNIRGVMARYLGDEGFMQALVDWRGMQGHDRREAFDIIVMGEWQRPHRIFLAGGLIMLNHLAKQSNPPADQYVVDNFVANPYIGIDLSALSHPIDSLTFRAGTLASMTRDRADGHCHTSAGLWADIAVSWWRLSLQNTLCLSGKPLFPLYSQFGSLLHEGEPFYASDFYNRTTIKGNIINYKNMVSLDAALDFNVARDNFTFYQRLLLRVTI